MKNSIDSLLEKIAGINSFIESLSSVISTITSFAGIKVIILLIFVMLISSLLTTLGIRRGKASFFASLLLADSLWILWQKSFEPVTTDFIFTLIKTNLFIAMPLLIISFLAAVMPMVTRKAASFFRMVFRKLMRGKEGYEADTLLNMLDTHKRISIDLEGSLLRDVMESGNGPVIISSGTRRLARGAEIFLREISNGRDKGGPAG
jgi:hypothetical protein